MQTRCRRWHGWRTWLLLPIFGILALLDNKLPLSPGWHKVIEIGIVLVIYGLLWIWLQANQIAWLRESTDETERDRNA